MSIRQKKNKNGLKPENQLNKTHFNSNIRLIGDNRNENAWSNSLNRLVDSTSSFPMEIYQLLCIELIMVVKWNNGQIK